MNLSDLILEMQKRGYKPEDANARVCQDIVLKAISQSALSRNVKDVYDMYYQCGKMDPIRLAENFRILILDDSGMREHSLEDIISRIRYTFSNAAFRQRADLSDKRWMDEDINTIFETIISYLSMIHIDR